MPLKKLKLSKNGTALFDTSLSNDGGWQERGFASMNGIITTISLNSGRVIETVLVNRYCQKCVVSYKFKATDSLKYETFLSMTWRFMYDES